MASKTNKDIAGDIRHKLGNPIFALETNLTPLKLRIKNGRTQEALDVLNDMEAIVDKLRTQFLNICERLEVPLCIGITGGIACGKSAVGDMLSKMGALVIDTDDLSHELMASPNPTYDAVLARFGNDIATAPGGPIDRKLLGHIVFSDEAARRDLEKIMHPAIHDLMQRRVTEKPRDRVVAVLVPLLFESGIQNYFDEVWTIKVDPRTQLKRLMRRNNKLTREQALARINAQWSQDKKIGLSDRVIDNSGRRCDTRKIVKRRLHSAMKNAHLA